VTHQLEFMLLTTNYVFSLVQMVLSCFAEPFPISEKKPDKVLYRNIYQTFVNLLHSLLIFFNRWIGV